MIAQPKISVVCAWYNRADYIRDTLNSLLAQDYPNFDITVVNDGSSDPRVREILDSYNDPRLRVLHQENTGFTTAIRRAISESHGTFIAIQGAGDISHPTRLSEQAAFLSQNSSFAVVGCRYSNQVITSEGLGSRYLAKTHTFKPTSKDLVRGNPFSHGETMIRRAAYNAVGGYRVLFENAQDKDLWMRLSTKYDLGIINRELYERKIFLADGIAADLRKTIRQIAYSRLADKCHADRLKGRKDIVEKYGSIAIMKTPKDFWTGIRLVRAAKQITIFNRKRSDLSIIRELYGFSWYAVCFLAASFFRVAYRKSTNA